MASLIRLWRVSFTLAMIREEEKSSVPEAITHSKLVSYVCTAPVFEEIKFLRLIERVVQLENWKLVFDGQGSPKIICSPVHGIIHSPIF